MPRQPSAFLKSKSSKQDSSFVHDPSIDELDNSHRKLNNIVELSIIVNSNTNKVIPQTKKANNDSLLKQHSGTAKTKTKTKRTDRKMSGTLRSTSFSEEDNDMDYDSCPPVPAQPETTCTIVKQKKDHHNEEPPRREDPQNAIIIVEPPSPTYGTTCTVGSHAISQNIKNRGGKAPLDCLEIPSTSQYHPGLDSSSSTSSQLHYLESNPKSRKSFKKRLSHRRHRRQEVASTKALPDFKKQEQHYLCRNDSSIKSCLKQSPSSLHKKTASGDDNDDQHVKFGTIQIREYERTVGDNPSCNSGPPLTIGWKFVPITTSVVTADDNNHYSDVAEKERSLTLPRDNNDATYKCNIPVEQYEMQRQDERRSLEDLRLSGWYREDLLRDEWDIPPHDIRMAKYEARKVRQQRIESYHYHYLEKIHLLWESIARAVKRRSFLIFTKKCQQKEQEQLWKDALEYSQSKSVTTQSTTQGDDYGEEAENHCHGFNSYAI
mmetsp:Transcript_4247/g.6086  ORF Transcript_4247/g.6086 Transcript_4247/m.6086 type:complete len:490 (-) Transcript_4247:21-1490(-)